MPLHCLGLHPWQLPKPGSQGSTAGWPSAPRVRADVSLPTRAFSTAAGGCLLKPSQAVSSPRQSAQPTSISPKPAALCHESPGSSCAEVGRLSRAALHPAFTIPSECAHAAAHPPLEPLAPRESLRQPHPIHLDSLALPCLRPASHSTPSLLVTAPSQAAVWHATPPLGALPCPSENAACCLTG